MTSVLSKTLYPDNKGRVCIGSLIEEGISSFRAYVDKKHRIILEPFVEIPAQELWVHKNKKALVSVKKGLEQSAKGKTKSLGSFAKHLKSKS
ncbi:MAG: hypothetical protein FJ368_00880 [Pelagibacterales bacterium]|nr:hypothetical protein [Pelagibacterales bacterium]